MMERSAVKAEVSLKVNPLARKPADPASLINVPELVTAYYTKTPDHSVPGQRVSLGASAYRGSAFENSFNEWHILAFSQAICLYRKQQKIDGRCSSAGI
jgi:phosphoglucomutase